MVKILFIDDQKFNHKVIDFILKDQEYNIYFEFNGKDGILRAKEVFPDLILLDIEMPILNGFDTCKEFRNMIETKDTPIIFLSSHEEEDYIVKAFEYGGSDYISKPFKPREVIARIKSHLEKFFLKQELQYKKNELIQKNDELNKLLKEVQKNRELEKQLYVYKDKYHTLQQEDAFKKQLKIIKDELSHKYFGDVYFDVFYKPIDILSGDTYGTLKVKDGVYFLYIIDAMGKGLSASVTSIQSTSFINNAASIGIARDDFRFDRVINSYTNYISKQILDDEMVCGIFVLLNMNDNTMSFSSYGMPPILFQDRDGNINLIKNNNPPIMEFLIGDSMDIVDISNLNKLLFYSDGLNELTTKQNSHYSSILPNDFVESTTINQLLKKIEDNMVNGYEDDMTVIMVKSLFEEKVSQVDFEILPSLSSIEEFLTTFDDEVDIDFVSKVDISLALNELLLNAFEHGTIGITYDQKQKLLDSDTFDEYITQKERELLSFNKKIKISIIKYNIINETNLMRVIVEDSGDGFDVSFIIKEVNFANNIRWHGRGIKLTQTLVDAIFYNNIGNKAEIFKIFKGE